MIEEQIEKMLFNTNSKRGVYGLIRIIIFPYIILCQRKEGVPMNKALEILQENQYTCVAIKDDFEYHSKLNGIAPIMQPMLENEFFFKDCEVADKVIGKSAAMLLIKSQVLHIHAMILSEHAKDILDKYHISYTYDKLVPYIINRTKDGMCPMENTVLDIDDLEQGFYALQETLKKLRNQK